MSQQSIKNNAKSLFNSKVYSEAFVCLEQLGCSGFTEYLLKNDQYLYGTEASNYFWSQYILNSALFDEVFASEDALSLLHYYFSKEKIANHLLLKKLAEKFPKQLISAIRVNKAFVTAVHAESLGFLKEHSNKYLRDHYIVFTRISNFEKKVFDDFELALKNCERIRIVEAMNVASLWLEEKRAWIFNDPNNLVNPYDIHEKLEVIGFFCSYFLQQNHNEIKI